MNVENIVDVNVKKELKLLEKKYVIIKKYVDYLLSDITTEDVYKATYKIVIKILKDKDKFDSILNEVITKKDIINCLVLELNKKYLNYPYIEFIHNLLISALSLDNKTILHILDDVDNNELNVYDKISYLYNNFNNKQEEMNKKRK